MTDAGEKPSQCRLELRIDGRSDPLWVFAIGAGQPFGVAVSLPLFRPATAWAAVLSCDGYEPVTRALDFQSPTIDLGVIKLKKQGTTVASLW